MQEFPGCWKLFFLQPEREDVFCIENGDVRLPYYFFGRGIYSFPYIMVLKHGHSHEHLRLFLWEVIFAYRCDISYTSIYTVFVHTLNTQSYIHTPLTHAHLWLQSHSLKHINSLISYCHVQVLLFRELQLLPIHLAHQITPWHHGGFRSVFWGGSTLQSTESNSVTWSQDVRTA